MSRITKLFAANAIAVAGLCSAALALSPSAAADPLVAPAVPGVPALNMLQQFATNPASAAALLQTAATALGGASSLAGAPATMPVSPIAGAPATAPVAGAPATAPVAPAASGGLAGPIIPLLNQLGMPGDLANLTPSDMPFPVQVGNNLSVGNPPAAAPSAIPPVAGPAGVPPASNPAIAPTTPGGAGLGQLLPLSALP
ncbi:hypothetical protein ACXDF8_16595 [Mycolicibacterium sp. CBM1]